MEIEVGYRFCRELTRWILLAGFRIRGYGLGQIPQEGGVILASNHQSFLDPICLGAVIKRPIHFMARETLFDVPGFGPLIRTLNAVPLKRGKADMRAFEHAVRTLKGGEPLAIFPEGTRASEDRLGRIKPGVGWLAREAMVPIVPVIQRGTFRAWPRHRRFPRTTKIEVHFGAPLQPAGSPREAASMLEERMREMDSRIPR